MSPKMPPGWKIIDSVLTFKTEQILEQDFDYKKAETLYMEMRCLRILNCMLSGKFQ